MSGDPRIKSDFGVHQIISTTHLFRFTDVPVKNETGPSSMVERRDFLTDVELIVPMLKTKQILDISFRNGISLLRILL